MVIPLHHIFDCVHVSMPVVAYSALAILVRRDLLALVGIAKQKSSASLVYVVFVRSFPRGPFSGKTLIISQRVKLLQESEGCYMQRALPWINEKCVDSKV